MHSDRRRLHALGARRALLKGFVLAVGVGAIGVLLLGAKPSFAFVSGPLCPIVPPTNTAPPTIINGGSVNPSTTLSASPGGWSSCGPITGYDYQWHRQTPTARITIGSNSSSYPTVTADGSPDTVSVAAAACNDGGCSAYVESSNWAVVGYPEKGISFHCADYQSPQPPEDATPYEPVYSGADTDTGDVGNILGKLASAHVREVKVTVSWVRMADVPQSTLDNPPYLQTVKACVNDIVNKTSYDGGTHKMKALLTFQRPPLSAQTGYLPGNRSSAVPRPPSDCAAWNHACTSVIGPIKTLITCLTGNTDCSNCAVADPPNCQGAACIPSCAVSTSKFALEIEGEPNNRNQWKPVCDSTGRIVNPQNNDPSAICDTLPTTIFESERGYEEYYWLLKAAWGAAHPTNNSYDVTVSTGGPLQAGYVSMADWTGDLYSLACGSPPCSSAPPWDVVGLHPYPGDPDPGNSCPTVNRAFTQPGGIMDVQNLIRSYEPTNRMKPIWLTEFGWSVNGRGGQCADVGQQAPKLDESLTYTDLYGNVNEVFWFISDRGVLLHNVRAPATPTCPNSTNWICGTNGQVYT